MRGLAKRILSRTIRPWGLGLPLLDLAPTLDGQAKWHQDFIIHLACILKPEIYVELGIFKCGLFNRMVPLAGKAIGVDANPEAGQHMVRAPNVRFVSATTADFARQLKAAPIAIDMLFIDADHSKEAVMADFRSFLPFVRPQGLILLHDTHPIDEAATASERCGDGYLAIEELSREREDFEMMTIPVHPGLTCCRKRQRQLSWQSTTDAAQ